MIFKKNYKNYLKSLRGVAKLSKSNKKELINGLEANEISLEDVFHCVDYGAIDAQLAEYLYSNIAKNKKDKFLVVQMISKENIQNISDSDVIKDLIHYDYVNFDYLNFQELRKPENDAKFADIFVVYGNELLSDISKLKRLIRQGFDDNETIDDELNIVCARWELIVENYQKAKEILNKEAESVNK